MIDLQERHNNPSSTMRGLVITVLLGLTMDVTSGMGSIQLIPQYPTITGSVTLSITGVTERIAAVSWFKGPNTNPRDQILGYYPGVTPPLVTGSLYNPRFSAFNNGSLHIKDLLITDGGNYIVQIQTSKQEVFSVTLTVYEPITKPKITASIPQPKENDILILYCDTLRAMMITWTMRGPSISSKTKLSGDNKTLIFSSITREDSGEYQCEAQNLVSKESSDPYTVTVTYGPDKAKIEGTLFVNPGSPITLSCSADSFPPPEYQWKVNGTVSQEKTDKYNIINAQTEDQGTYTCVVKNPVTSRTATTSVYVNVTTEYQGSIHENGPYIGLILGLAFPITLGLVLVIIGSVCLYRKRVKKRLNESPDIRRENIPVYENVTGAKPKEESSYMDLRFRSEDTYTELKR